VKILLLTVQHFCLKTDDNDHQFPKSDLCICVLLQTSGNCTVLLAELIPSHYVSLQKMMPGFVHFMF